MAHWLWAVQLCISAAEPGRQAEYHRQRHAQHDAEVGAELQRGQAWGRYLLRHNRAEMLTCMSHACKTDSEACHDDLAKKYQGICSLIAMHHMRRQASFLFAFVLARLKALSMTRNHSAAHLQCVGI